MTSCNVMLVIVKDLIELLLQELSHQSAAASRSSCTSFDALSADAVLKDMLMKYPSYPSKEQTN